MMISCQREVEVYSFNDRGTVISVTKDPDNVEHAVSGDISWGQNTINE